SERVPRQLAQEPVVLVQVVPVVGEDHVRLDLALELLEGALDVAAVVGEERVRKPTEAHLDRRAGEQCPGAPLGLASACLVGAADDDPADLEPAVEPLQAQQGTAAADLEVVGVRAEREDAQQLRRPGRPQADHAGRASGDSCWTWFQTAHGGRPLAWSAARLCLYWRVSS